LEIQFRSTT